LHFAHGETEGPGVGGKVVEHVIWEISAMHLGDDIMVVHVGSIFEECHTVNVEGGTGESTYIIPILTSRMRRNEVERLHWVVKVAEVNVRISVRGDLMLCLGDEKFVFCISEVLTFICV
tara:strand:+ start:177 stop:533 length:357 start_codon:yes stop_codon:yes gene_type:complete